MTAFWESSCGLVTTYVGDSVDVLRQLPDNSVHCCVTSPPYYGLRDYGTGTWAGGIESCDHLGEPFRTSANVNANTDSGGDDVKNKEKREPFLEMCGKCGALRVDRQIGLEKTPQEFIAKLVEVFREVRRVLHPSGTCWVNMGDSYNSHPGQRTVHDKAGTKQETNKGSETTPSRSVPSCKPKDLLGIPWLLAFALRDDGWYLRQDIIWAKPSPMPESVTDRCTKSHEYVFLLTKNPVYFYDAEAIKERCSEKTNARASQAEIARISEARDAGANSSVGKGGTPKSIAPDGMTKQNDSFENACCLPVSSRNRRSVWNVASAPYAEAHFATYPPELIRPMIRAGTSEKGCCPKCLAPWERITEREKLKRERPNDYVKRVPERPLGEKLADAPSDVRASASARMGRGAGWRKEQGNMCANSVAGVSVQTKGWEPSCKCDAGEPVPCTVLDIFGGSGTSGMVARQEGRRCILIELNQKYATLHRSRVLEKPQMAAEEEAGLFSGLE